MRALRMGARASRKAHCAGNVLTWHSVGGAFGYVQRVLQRGHHPTKAHRRGLARVATLRAEGVVLVPDTAVRLALLDEFVHGGESLVDLRVCVRVAEQPVLSRVCSPPLPRPSREPGRSYRLARAYHSPMSESLRPQMKTPLKNRERD